MRDKVLIAVGLPLVWLVVAVGAYRPGVDRVYLLAVAPSVWLFLFVDPLEVTVLQMQVAAFVPMVLAGLVLVKLRMPPRLMATVAAATAFALWLALAIYLARSPAAQDPHAAVLWLLCCFNFALALLPIFAITARLFQLLRRTLTRWQVV